MSIEELLVKNTKAYAEYQVEKAENAIRAKHNELENQRWFGKKNYFAYDSSKFITMVNTTSELLNALKEDS